MTYRFFLSGACVKTLAASFFASEIVGFFSPLSTFEASDAIGREVFSFLPICKFYQLTGPFK